MRNNHGLSAELTSQEQDDTPPEEITFLMFQSVRELLFNVRKHAGTKKSQFALLSVRRSFRGANSNQPNRSHGLTLCVNRIRAAFLILNRQLVIALDRPRARRRGGQ